MYGSEDHDDRGGFDGSLGQVAASDWFSSPFTVTYFDDHLATRKSEEQTTLNALAAQIRTTQAPGKAQLPWLKLARFGDHRTAKNSLRHDANVLVITGVELDYDGGVVTVEEATELLLKAGVLSLIYTSPSHTADRPRWRVLCPTSVELPPNRRMSLMGRLNGLLWGAASSESWTLSQAYYYGRVGANPDHHVKTIDGTPIDLLDELDEGWRGKGQTTDRLGTTRNTSQAPRSGPIDEQALIQQIVSGESYHTASVRLLGRWVLDGMPMMAAHARLQDAMKAVAEADRDDRWQGRYNDLDRCLLDIYGREAEKRDAGGRSARTIAVTSRDGSAGGGRPASLAAHTLGALLDDTSPMPADLIGPRLLPPGGMLVLGGAPKVGKSDFLLNLQVHAAVGIPFLRFVPARPLRIFYLQAEIQYHYLRERLQKMPFDPAILAPARDTFAATPKLRMILNEDGVGHIIALIRHALPDAPPDVICIDPIRNLFDGGPNGEGENDNNAMLFFLQQRVEAMRDEIAPEAGVILVHHTKKVTKQQIKDDPFLALSGASALRGFYTSGMVLFRPDEDQTFRELHIELRNGPALEPMRIDKRDGGWGELDRNDERLVRKDYGRKLDAERERKRDVIVQELLDEARVGRLYTGRQFAEAFDNQAGLGGSSTIRERISTLVASVLDSDGIF